MLLIYDAIVVNPQWIEERVAKIMERHRKMVEAIDG